MKIGDKINVGYLRDCDIHNYKEGKIIWANPFKYYPNGNINEFIMKTQILLEFENKDTMYKVI